VLCILSSRILDSKVFHTQGEDDRPGGVFVDSRSMLGKLFLELNVNNSASLRQSIDALSELHSNKPIVDKGL
jgi:hypothetical protein